MLELIPKQKIEETAKDFVYDIHNDNVEYTKEEVFIEAANFALKEVEPLICELLDWLQVPQLFEDFTNVDSRIIIEKFIEERNK